MMPNDTNADAPPVLAGITLGCATKALDPAALGALTGIAKRGRKAPAPPPVEQQQPLTGAAAALAEMFRDVPRKEVR